MKFSCLSSGSSGNCFYVESNNQAVLFDAGISAKQTFQRLENLGVDKNKIKAILISHEHTDHTKGADVLSRALNVPIFATRGTIKNSFLSSNEGLINQIKPLETLKLAGLQIEPIPKSHDAAEPISFIVQNKKILSILTDIGYSCKNVSSAIFDSDYLVIEANHDIKMLEEGPYPWFLKKRILSDQGHISNLHSALSVLENSTKNLKSITLAHLSQTNNNPEIAKETFEKILKERKALNPELIISTRDEQTKLISCS